MGRPRKELALSPTFDRLMRPPTSPAAVARREGVPCSECHAEHVLPSGKPSCDGHNAAGKPCRNAPIRGGYVCSQRHGGRAPHVVRAAKQRLQYLEAEGEVARLLREVQVPGGTRPLDGLLDAVARTGGMVALLGGLVGKLDLDPATTWETVQLGKDAHRSIRTTANAAVAGYDDRGNEVPSVYVELYERWLALYVRAAKTALDADVDERMVRNATATSASFMRAVEAGFTQAGLTPKQQHDFREAVATELRHLGVMSELVPTP